MSMSTFQKVTLATCLVLCVALLLPKMLLTRGRKEAAERPEGNNKPSARSCPPHRAENMKRKISKVAGVTADQEESLLQQLSEITRVMQEGQLVEGILPEKKVQEDWDNYPEEPHPCWDGTQCCCQHSPKGESDADRTEDVLDNQMENLPGDFIGAGDAEPSQKESEEGVKEEELEHQHNMEGGELDLGFPEGHLAGVLKDLDLKVTSMLEQEKAKDITRPVETETSSSSVRRRNKRRKAKKAAP
ncbi:hypothetical protein XENOCAPTIV_028885 [Xenoophorus captivus]|uniref:Uncharacterized protein n=1 Tax=Xenoophorus captivus TaxID=1517983 RepID=A0ABV0R751_9TELE